MKKFIGVLGFIVLSSLGAFAAEVKEWTVLVYMNSDNNLWEYGQLNMAEMEKVGSSSAVNIVVEQDPEPRDMPTTRYYVTQNPQAKPGQVTSKILQKLGETDMGDWKHLSDFIVWGAQNFPAKHYAVIVWNHGAGWQGVSYDDSSGNHMSMPNLAKALKTANQSLIPLQAQRGLYSGRGPVIDILNFDACLMSTIEVGFELKDGAKIMVGSQFLEPGEGENYTAFLTPLVQKPTMTASEFAQRMVYEYAFRYAKGRAGINYLAVDLSKMAQFTQLFSVVADKHLSAPSSVQGQLKSAYRQNRFYGDLIGGMQVAQKISAESTPLASAIDNFIKMYGYPAESVRSVEMRNDGQRTNKIYHVVRYYPGTVYYQFSGGGPSQSVDLVKQGDGSYEAEIPALGGGMMQYQVFRRSGANGFDSGEALTTVIEGADPIVFHNNFPPTSPVIADAYNFATKGAHGMTLFFFSGREAARKKQIGSPDILNQIYMQLQFALVGAPSWTKFFGY